MHTSKYFICSGSILEIKNLKSFIIFLSRREICLWALWQTLRFLLICFFPLSFSLYVSLFCFILPSAFFFPLPFYIFYPPRNEKCFHCICWFSSYIFFSLEGMCRIFHCGDSSLFFCSVVSDSLRPRGLQHARLSCLSLYPRVCSVILRSEMPSCIFLVLPIMFLLQLSYVSSSFLDPGWRSAPNVSHLRLRQREKRDGCDVMTLKPSKWPETLLLTFLRLWSEPHQMSDLTGQEM